MRDYVIITDSTTDMSADYYKKEGVILQNFPFTLDGKEYIGNSSLTGKEFYDKIRAGKMPTTAQINIDTFEKLFGKFASQGNDILYLGFSSGLSGTFGSAVAAAAEVRNKYPDTAIETVDSLSASMGEGLLLYYAVENKKKGLSLSENVNWLITNRLKLCHWFTVDDLQHLYRGGRVSKTAAVVGTMLGIKPILHVDDAGHLISVEKVRGRQKAIDGLFEKISKTIIHPEEQTVFISHGDCLEEAQLLGKRVKKELKVKDVLYGQIGPAVGAHSGPGTIAIFFIGTER